MDIGVGLPNGVPGVSSTQLIEWAQHAEERGFSTLGAIDRLAYSNYEPLIALSAAAAVTARIGLCSSVLLPPLRSNAAALAKQVLSVQALSDGRLTLGIGVGGRDDDFALAEASIGRRGSETEAMLMRMQGLWDSESIGPDVTPPRLIIGGAVDASFERVARLGAGWIAGGVGPDQFAKGAEKVRAAWRRAGREGAPWLMCLAYYALGDDPDAEAHAYLADYYAWLGEDMAALIARSAAKDNETVKRYLAGFESVGCDELLLFPCSGNLLQLNRLATAVGLGEP